MFGALGRDAVELARTATGDVSRRSVARVVLANESYRITALFRVRQAARRWHVPLVNHLLRRVQTILFAIEIDRDVTLGDGVYFVHPMGTVVGGDSRIGARVRFYGNNTVGTIRDDGYPTIEDDVWVGAGARILGPIRVGAGARIGANAVVLQDVPPNHVAVGVPAKLHPRRDLGTAPGEAPRVRDAR